MRTALYVRVSTEMQTEGYSISEQLERLRSYCSSRDWTIHKEYVDGGFSGSNLDRPAMKELIKDASNKMFDVVLVYKLDRLSRSQKDTLHLIEEVFNRNGIAFNSMTESFDTSSPFGIASLGMMSVFAQLERSTISNRMHMGRVGRAKKGLYRGATPPVGYDYIDGQLLINEYEAFQVKTIYKMFNDGMSINSIQNYMNEHYTNKYSNYCHNSAIRRILTNPTYAGKVRYGGEIYDGQHEAIIPKDYFDSTQLLYEKRHEENYSPTSYKAASLLSGYLYCAKCGSKIYQSNRGTRNRHGNPKKYQYTYVCKNRTEKKVSDPDKCYCKIWRQLELDQLIIDEIKKLKYDENYFDEVKSTEIKKDDDSSVIYDEIEKVENQISRLLELYSVGNMPINAISSQIQDLKEKQDKLYLSLETLPKKPKIMEKQDIMNIADAVEEVFENGTLVQKRDYVQSLIKRIEINDDEVHIYWNF